MATNEDIEEIYLGRLRYLESVDDILEQILEDQYSSTIINQKIGQEIGQEMDQENDIRIESEMPLAFASNF